MKLRVARHTDDLEAIQQFYTEVLNFEVLGSFDKHQNYNGVFLGVPNADWHFEFTSTPEKAKHHFDEDDLLVLYPETQKTYDVLLETILKSNVSFVTAKNPYWNENGKMLLDPDGYRIVISNLKVSGD
jgi:catechol 2,3-dioxygenase-like lactoylglutathione lyase family enzyme